MVCLPACRRDSRGQSARSHRSSAQYERTGSGSVSRSTDVGIFRRRITVGEPLAGGERASARAAYRLLGGRPIHATAAPMGDPVRVRRHETVAGFHIALRGHHRRGGMAQSYGGAGGRRLWCSHDRRERGGGVFQQRTIASAGVGKGWYVERDVAGARLRHKRNASRHSADSGRATARCGGGHHRRRGERRPAAGVCRRRRQ